VPMSRREILSASALAALAACAPQAGIVDRSANPQRDAAASSSSAR